MKPSSFCAAWLALASIVTTAAAATLTLPVQEDTWVSGLGSTTIHANDQTLGICPVANYWIYLKFDLSGIDGIVTAAELRMRRVEWDPLESTCRHASLSIL